MCRFLLFISLFCSSLITNALPANANEARRYSPPITPAPQILDAPSPIKKKTNIVLKKYQLSELSNKYKLSSITIKNNLLVGTVEKGCDIYKLSDFYIEYYKKIGNEDINKISKAAVLTMIIELNSTEKSPAIVNDDNGNLLLLAGRKVIFSEPLTLVGKREINHIFSRINNNNLKIHGKTKPGDTPSELSLEMPYNFRSHGERVNEFMFINSGIFSQPKDYRTMASNAHALYLSPYIVMRSELSNYEALMRSEPSNYQEAKVEMVGWVEALEAKEEMVVMVEIKDPIFSLKYDLTNRTIHHGSHYVLFDFSIFEVKNCDGDECLSEEVKKELQKSISKNIGITVYPLFDKEIFSIPNDVKSEQLKDALNFNTNIKEKYTTLSKNSCKTVDDKRCYVSIRDKILLEYSPQQQDVVNTSFNFLIIDNLKNIFIDAINISMTLSVKKDEQGEDKLVISNQVFSKLEASITFPEEIKNKHTLVVLKDQANTTFALFSKENEGALNLSSWSANSSDIDKFIKKIEKNDFFKDSNNFIAYSSELKRAAMPNENKDIFKIDSCDLANTIEVIYPNQKKYELSPIPIEYLTTDKEDKHFVGDCYLVSHRPVVAYKPGGTINRIDIYLDTDKERTDGPIQNIVTEFEKLQHSYTFEKNCDQTESPFGRINDCSVLRLKNSEGWQPVYWHKNYPKTVNNQRDSLLIFNGHFSAGKFSFNDYQPIIFGEALGNMKAPNYLLNACGDENYPLNEVTLRPEFHNLIYANKPIRPEDAAISMSCAIDHFIEISSGEGECKDMSTWMAEVRTCMKKKLGTDQLNQLAFHIIGQMGEKLCKD